MSRSGYSDDIDDHLQLARWRSAVRSAINGKRGQAFLKEMLAALDALPSKRLVREHLIVDGTQPGIWRDPDLIVGGDELVDAATGAVYPMGSVCALGSVARARGTNVSSIDPEDSHTVADTFGIANAMTCEIVYINDECGHHGETPEARWLRVREWVVKQIKTEAQPAGPPPGETPTSGAAP